MRFVTFGLAMALFLGPVCASAQQQAEATDAPADDTSTYELFNLFGSVFERIRDEYVEETSDKELIEAAISGMLSSLDPHSSYLSADNFKDMQVENKGEFGGLGIEVTMESGLVRVVSPIDETPAARAGIEPGDLISHLDEEPVLGLTLQEAVEKMRGPVGTDIEVTIRRDGREPFDVSITRAVIKIKSVRSRLEGDGDVGYLRITRFSEQTESDLKEAFEDLDADAEKPLKGYVLDLRNNPGGLLDQAIKVSDAFLDKGEIVSTRSRKPEDTQRFNAREGDLSNGLPVVVLINGGSASASEIVAGALQDHRRAVVMGEKSFGKGSVQVILPFSNQGAMRLTTSRYYTPSGNSIQAKGIVPDIEVKQARIEELDTAQRSEADLRGALDDGGENTPAGTETDEDAQAPEETPLIERDYQLARAIDLVRGASLFARVE